MRKEWRVKKGDDPMDVDHVDDEEKEGSQQGKDDQCSPCMEEELNLMKGKGKGPFQGYCNHCGKWGHRKADCRALTASLKGKDGKAKGEGKGDTKGKGKNNYDGWSYKGGGKGKGNQGWWKGKGKGTAMTLDIDSYGSNDWNSWSNPQFSFCLLEAADEEDLLSLSRFSRP